MKQSKFFDSSPIDLLSYERQTHSRGYQLIAGIDEAGRGPLAGPVVAAAVILPEGLLIKGGNDSKKLSPATRERLFDVIMEQAVSVGVGIGTPELIDRINILQATRHAMREALLQLNPQPNFILIDGITTIDSSIPQKTIKQGDSHSISIAAASIIAKVSRDRLMCELDEVYPGYGFTGHKGYGSTAHLEAICRLGPSPVHRLSFGGVKEHVLCLSS